MHYVTLLFRTVLFFMRLKMVLSPGNQYFECVDLASFIWTETGSWSLYYYLYTPVLPKLCACVIESIGFIDLMD